MRYWGGRRDTPEGPRPDDERQGGGRHRRQKGAQDGADTSRYASSPPQQEQQGQRPRDGLFRRGANHGHEARQRRGYEQPRDERGRFRSRDQGADGSEAPRSSHETPQRPERRDGRDERDPRDDGDRQGRPERADQQPAGEQPRPRQARYSWRDFELGDELPRVGPHTPDTPDLGDGRRHCGELESILYRQWNSTEGPPSPEVTRAVDSLAAMPDQLKGKLADGVDGIYVGSGGVPELDDMEHLRGQPLPSGVATWDVCAGAYGDRKVVVGDQPSPTPDVMMHEIGHALDDVDGSEGQWQSDSAEFRALYDQCLPHLESDFHRQPNDLGRREFFADAFAAISSRQRPALLDMVGGDTRHALNVMLYFNRRYGI